MSLDDKKSPSNDRSSLVPSGTSAARSFAGSRYYAASDGTSLVCRGSRLAVLVDSPPSSLPGIRLAPLGISIRGQDFCRAALAPPDSAIDSAIEGKDTLVTMWVEADGRFRVERDACHVRGELRVHAVAA